jgi:hypothetical protein
MMYVYARSRKVSFLIRDVLNFVPSRSNTLLQERTHKGFVDYEYASCPAKLEIPDELGSRFMTEQLIVRLLGQRGAEVLEGRTISFAPQLSSQVKAAAAAAPLPLTSCATTTLSGFLSATAPGTASDISL